MAFVKKIEEVNLEKPRVHGEAECTYSTFKDEKGNIYLQIDTYGSNTRECKGKKSQTTQFGPEALSQLKTILKDI